MLDNIFTLWPGQPGLSAVIWLAIAILVMYLGRASFHQLINATGKAVRSSLRLASRSIANARDDLVRRNKEVILNAGRENLERTIEREFSRVHVVVNRDLANYPALHRELRDTVSRIQEDYQESTEAAPLPPAWLDAVEAVAAIPRTADSPVGSILENIQKTIETAHKETLEAYKKSSLGRHRQLGKLQPMVTKLSGTLDEVKHSVDGLQDRTELIDQHMQSYEEIRRGDDQAARLLTSSSLTQFFIAGLVLVIAILGGLINFQLIAMPMSEMVGGNSYIGSMKTSDIAALVIIMVEVAMGLFLMESLRITRLFPVIASMDDKMRRRMMVITFTILTILATIEASLAYMRDLLALDREALTQSLAGVAAVEAEFRWIPSIGQMVMGFILPFALAFVAIPLESFIHALRTVCGMALVMVLHVFSVALRTLGNLSTHLCRFITSLYDLVIMIPLSVEKWIASASAENRGGRREGIEEKVILEKETSS